MRTGRRVDIERAPGSLGSTADLFRLPSFFQYGIGSAGFGVWREVAAHTMTTRWVLDRQYSGFPLLHHWRQLPQTWLATGPGDAAYEFLDRALREGSVFMWSRGMVHFDAHVRNLLTDGHRVYFADCGLAAHTGFARVLS
ncbi:hypothetical protein [Actinoplanes sp. NPDC051851]|uniref:hypothetical protein n=1 Tax=Actinoplanes sp. NPDC051851 TaxID=3154753 RepID=UPI003440B535